jgi:poly-beta-1,6 N-acetyl-D-glucosamine synthase
VVKMLKNFIKTIIDHIFLIKSASTLALASSIGIFIGVFSFPGKFVPLFIILIASIFRLNIVSMSFGFSISVLFPLVYLFISLINQSIPQINSPLVSSILKGIEEFLKIFQSSKINIGGNFLIALTSSLITYFLFKVLYSSIFSNPKEKKELVSGIFQNNTGKLKKFLKTYSITFLFLLLIIFTAYETSLYIKPTVKDIKISNITTGSSTKSKPTSERNSTTSKHPSSNINLLFQVNSKEENNYLEKINETNVFAFYVSWDKNSKTSLKKNIKKINVVIPDWFHLNDDLTVRSDNQVEIDKIIKKNNVKIMPLISNYRDGKWDRRLVHELISTEEKRSKHVDNLLSLVKDGKYYGVNIDYENIAPTDKDNFVNFIKALSEKFHENGYSVSINLNFQKDEIFNYKKFINYVDYIIIMLYDENHLNGKPGPIASQRWFKNQLDSLEDISREKLVISLANYGYNWALSSNIPTKLLTFTEVITLADHKKLKIKWDLENFNPNFTYKDGTQEHIVWFLDASTLYNQLKYSLEIGIPNVALWRLGSEDAGIWEYIDKGKNIGGYIETLQKINGTFFVDRVGIGEVIKVNSFFKEGIRNIESNEDKFVINQKYISFPSNYKVERYGGTNEKKIVLTFDDGPNKSYTPKILDILKSYGIKASFFIIGKYAVKHPDIIKRIYDEGHEIGNHTFSHPDFFDVSTNKIKKELNATQRVIQQITGHSTLLFRFPYGLRTRNITKNELEPLMAVQDHGYMTIDFYIDPKDWKGISSDEIYEKIEKQLSRGNIVLLHDSGGNRNNTIKALPLIIERLKNKGYEFVSIGSLIGKNREDIMPLTSNANDNVLSILHGTAILILSSFLKFTTALFLVGIVTGVFRMIFLVFYSKQHYNKRKKYQIDKEFQPFVTIVIAAFNEEKVICKTINSILESDYNKFEIILVNDGSKDSTSETVKETYKTNQSVSVIDKENGGKSTALNLGFKSSKGEVVIILDADTIISHDAISLLVSNFKDETLAAVSGNVKVGNANNMITKWQHIEYVVGFNLEKRAFSMHNCITVVPGAFGAWRKAAVAQCGYFKEDTIAEDTDLTLELLRNGYRVEFEDKAYAYTEAPETMKDLLKQRSRWAYGILQCLWKHRDMVFDRKYKSLGTIGLPNMWLFQYVFQPLAPLADIVFIIGVLEDNTYSILLYYITFLTVDLLTTLYAFRLEKESMKVLVHIFLQRIIYRLIMSYIVIKSILSAIKGARVVWNKLIRIGSVKEEDQI